MMLVDGFELGGQQIFSVSKLYVYCFVCWYGCVGEYGGQGLRMVSAEEFFFCPLGDFCCYQIYFKKVENGWKMSFLVRFFN